MSQVAAAIADLKLEEGWRASAYDDADGKPVVKGKTLVGYVTVGYGFCIDAVRGHPLPRIVGDFWLQTIVNGVERDLLQWPAFRELRPGFQRALIQLAYQMGAEPFDGDGVRDWQNMLSAMERDDPIAAAKHLLDSKVAREQTPARMLRVAEIVRKA